MYYKSNVVLQNKYHKINEYPMCIVNFSMTSTFHFFANFPNCVFTMLHIFFCLVFLIDSMECHPLLLSIQIIYLFFLKLKFNKIL